MTTNQHIVILLLIAIFTFQAAILYHKSEKKPNKAKKVKTEISLK